MRHGKKINHLGRTHSHRKAMLANMACSLIEHKRIKTTLAKARALRVYVEPLITKSKSDTMHSRRTVFAYLRSKEAIKELFGEISVKVADRPGGYTRILKIGNRLGDNAEMALIELVDFNEFYVPRSAGKGKKPRTRRGGGGSTKKKDTEENAPQVESLNQEVSVADSAASLASIPQDDLKKVEGIGPAIEEVLNDFGILTFAQLEATPLERLQEILDNAGLSAHDPATWSEQAKLAGQGDWDKLKEWQDQLVAGRVVPNAEASETHEEEAKPEE